MKSRLFFFFLVALIVLFSSSLSLASVSQVTPFGRTSDEKTVSWTISVPLLDQSTGSVNFGINAVAKLSHSASGDIEPGDSLNIVSQLSEGSSSIGLALNDLGSYSVLEGSYSFSTDKFIGEYSIAIPNATANVPIVGDVGAYLSAEISVNTTFEVNGPGSFKTNDNLIHSDMNSKSLQFQIDSSASTDSVITVETTYCLFISDISIDVKASFVSLFDIGTGPFDQTWCSSAHLGMDITLTTVKSPGFELISIVLVISIFGYRRLKKSK